MQIALRQLNDNVLFPISSPNFSHVGVWESYLTLGIIVSKPASAASGHLFYTHCTSKNSVKQRNWRLTGFKVFALTTFFELQTDNGEHR